MTDAENPPPSNFRRPVLGCIETDFCNQILVGKRLTRSTRYAPNEKSQTSKFFYFFKILQILQDFDDFLRRSRNFDENLPDFHEISSDFWRIFKQIERGRGPGTKPCQKPVLVPPLAGGGGI